MKKLIVLLFLFGAYGAVYAQGFPSGAWFNEEKDAKIEFYEQGGKLFGKIVWLKEPVENGKPKVDQFNPDAKLKSRPLMGLVFLTGFEKDGNDWKGGKIYDPKTGKTYSSTIKWSGKNQLNVRGFIGVSVIGRTSKFTKAS